MKTEKPMDVAAFRASEEIHARFQMVGFRHNESKNAIDVSVRHLDRRCIGTRCFSRSRGRAGSESEDFYPKPYVPGILSFHVEAGDAAGAIHVHGTGRGSRSAISRLRRSAYFASNERRLE